MNIYTGASFNYAGTLRTSGSVASGTSGVSGDQADYSLWQVSANVFTEDGEYIDSITVTNNTNAVLPDTNGRFQLTATPSQTALWPVGKAQLVFKCVTPTGDVEYAKPIEFRIKPIPKGPTISS
ncbi:hypothetical protein AWB76_00907 [Caballeronia temeraria]|uniref:Uncharacterized protein n=1 Tax=Caballeronia temeraria TaxID=1777137 RepID=A0A157ZLL2_9BURK|nr:hypothetical protein [Caballeronia temeraria]SAK46410.1 hypothetical protein AWB76_00907 [Caballeronia temeraria]